ncbi:MAG: DUF1761 domain-containing protein [Pseudonocardia sp.]|nr:DUF1761 domain-containing protein [Pseudonocardia sp.]
MTTPTNTRTARHPTINYRAVLVAAVAALVASSVYYILLGGAYQALRPDPSTADPQAWKIVGQLARNIVMITVLAVVMRRLRISTVRDALGLAGLIWIGFQAVAVSGSVIHEQYPLGLFALHIGDALLTTVLSALILHAMRRGTPDG